MKTLLINCSPKKSGSASGRLRDLMQPWVCGEAAALHTASVDADLLEKLRAADNWIFFSPLYVDALPAHLLEGMLAIHRASLPPPKVIFGVINCGFYEGEQTRSALEVLGHWAAACGFRYGGGVGVGGGGAQATHPLTSRGPMRPILHALRQLAEQTGGAPAGPETTFTSVAFPRCLYRLAGEAGWRHDIRQGGGRPKDLHRRRPLET